MGGVEENLKLRHLDFDLHRPILDEENGVATFLLYNLSEQIVGYQQYRPNGEKTRQNDPREGKYFTFHRKTDTAVFGIESLHFGGPIFVCEGIFDACRLTRRGCSAIAVLSNNPSSDVKNFLFSIGRLVVVVADNDAAGKKLSKFGHVAVFTDEKDLGDSDESFVDDLIEKFC